MNRGDLLLVVIFGVAFGLLCIVNKKLASSDSHPAKILVFRCFVSLVLAAIALRWIVSTQPNVTLASLSKRDMFQSCIFVALTLLISWILMVLMKSNSASSVTCMCAGSGLLFAIILSSFMLGEAHNQTELIGLVITLAGIGILFKGIKQQEEK